MGQVLHGSATTTHAVRAAIQRSKATIADRGHFVPPCDPGALSDTIGADAGIDLSEQRQRRLPARQRVVDEFALSGEVETYSRLYEIGEN